MRCDRDVKQAGLAGDRGEEERDEGRGDTADPAGSVQQAGGRGDAVPGHQGAAAHCRRPDDGRVQLGWIQFSHNIITYGIVGAGNIIEDSNIGGK